MAKKGFTIIVGEGWRGAVAEVRRMLSNYSGIDFNFEISDKIILWEPARIVVQTKAPDRPTDRHHALLVIILCTVVNPQVPLATMAHCVPWPPSPNQIRALSTPNARRLQIREIKPTGEEARKLRNGGHVWQLQHEWPLPSWGIGLLELGREVSTARAPPPRKAPKPKAKGVSDDLFWSDLFGWDPKPVEREMDHSVLDQLLVSEEKNHRVKSDSAKKSRDPKPIPPSPSLPKSKKCPEQDPESNPRSLSVVDVVNEVGEVDGVECREPKTTLDVGIHQKDFDQSQSRVRPRSPGDPGVNPLLETPSPDVVESCDRSHTVTKKVVVDKEVPVAHDKCVIVDHSFYNNTLIARGTKVPKGLEAMLYYSPPEFIPSHFVVKVTHDNSLQTTANTSGSASSASSCDVQTLHIDPGTVDLQANQHHFDLVMQAVKQHHQHQWCDDIQKLREVVAATVPHKWEPEFSYVINQLVKSVETLQGRVVDLEAEVGRLRPGVVHGQEWIKKLELAALGHETQMITLQRQVERLQREAVDGRHSRDS